MKRIYLIASLMFIAIACGAQSKNIIGAWIWHDSKSEIHFIIKEDGHHITAAAHEMYANQLIEKERSVFELGC